MDITKKILKDIYNRRNYSGVNDLIDIFISEELRYSKRSIMRISKIQDYIQRSDKDVIIIFIDTKYISPALYPFFWSLIHLGKILNKKIRIGYNQNNSRLKKDLAIHGIFEHFNHDGSCGKDDNKIPYTTVSEDDSTNAIVQKTVQLLPVNMSNLYKNKFTSKLYEIFINAQKHSKSKLPTIANGYLERTYFSFSAYDAGVGIPYNVKEFLNDDLMSDENALQWALTENNSTAINSNVISRGAGLGVIEQFVKENNGTMMLVSGSCCYMVKNRVSSYFKIDNPIIGTFFSLRINMDKEHFYAVKEEEK